MFSVFIHHYNRKFIYTYFYLQFKIHERMDLFWRGNAWPQSCLVDASPLPPAAVSATSVSVFGLEFNGSSLFLNISWEAPEATHGTIVKYEIRVTSEPEMMDNQTGLELQPYLFSTVSGVTHFMYALHAPF